MAFGEFMKKLTNEIKSFGKKVKEVVQKVVPTVMTGTEWVKDHALPAVRNLANIVPGKAGDVIRKVSDAVDRTADNVVKYTGSLKENFLTPKIET